MSNLALAIVFSAILYALMKWIRSEIRDAVEESELRVREDIAKFHVIVGSMEDELAQAKAFNEEA